MVVLIYHWCGATTDAPLVARGRLVESCHSSAHHATVTTHTFTDYLAEPYLQVVRGGLRAVVVWQKQHGTLGLQTLHLKSGIRQRLREEKSGQLSHLRVCMGERSKWNGAMVCGGGRNTPIAVSQQTASTSHNEPRGAKHSVKSET